MATTTRLIPVLTLALFTLAVALPAAAGAQVVAPPAQAAPADPQLTSFAKAWVEVGRLRDEYEALMAQPKHKTLEHQATLRLEMKTKVEAAIQAAGLTVDAYRRIEFSITMDEARRAAFQQVLTAAEAASGQY